MPGRGDLSGGRAPRQVAAVRRDQLRVRQGVRRRQPADRQVRDRAQRPEPTAGISSAKPGTARSSSSRRWGMPSAWNAKRERQYEHVKESEQEQGRSTKRAKEIAARTVNKQRAEAGEAKTSSRSSSSRSSSSGGSSSRGTTRSSSSRSSSSSRNGQEKTKEQ